MGTEFCGLNTCNPTVLVARGYPWGWRGVRHAAVDWDSDAMQCRSRMIMQCVVPQTTTRAQRVAGLDSVVRFILVRGSCTSDKHRDEEVEDWRTEGGGKWWSQAEVNFSRFVICSVASPKHWACWFHSPCSLTRDNTRRLILKIQRKDLPPLNLEVPPLL